MRAFKTFLTKFHHNEEGVIATIIAVSFVGLLLAILALSIDLNRVQTSYGKNYNATDAAALGAAEWWLKSKVERIGESDNPLNYDPSQSEFDDYASLILDQNYKLDHSDERALIPSSLKVETSKKALADGKIQHVVKVSSCSDLATNIADSIDIADPETKSKVCTDSTAAFELGKLEDTEVAFALDFTESMFWKGISQDCQPGVNSDCPTLINTKAYNLYTTMEYVFDTYFDQGGDSTSFASIIPYAGFVNLYPYAGDGSNSSMVVQDAEDFQTSGKANWEVTSANNVVYNPLALQSYNKYHKDNGDFNKYSLTSQFRPLYTGTDAKTAGFGDYEADYNENYQTKDYSYVLNRIPALKNSELVGLAGGSKSSNFLPFQNYSYNLEEMRKGTGQTIVINPSARLNPFKDSAKPDEMYRRVECYYGMIAAGADQRIEKELHSRDSSFGEEEGHIVSSPYAKGLSSGREFELHESFAVQPLTNNVNILKQLVERFISDEFLYRNTLTTFIDEDFIIDRQRSRLNKSFDFSGISDTSSIHGLIWSWFNLSNDWEGRWNSKSLTEKFCDEGGTNLKIFEDRNDCNNQGGSSANSRSSNNLPNEDNSKHVIMVADGYDIDGQESDASVVNGQSGIAAGFRNACDAHTPVDRVSFNEYVDICERMKEEDITVHMILYDFTPDGSNKGHQQDLIESRARFNGEGMSRFQACAKVTGGGFFNGISPVDRGNDLDTSLKDVLDSVFLGILSDLTPVRLID